MENVSNDTNGDEELTQGVFKQFIQSWHIDQGTGLEQLVENIGRKLSTDINVQLILLNSS